MKTRLNRLRGGSTLTTLAIAALALQLQGMLIWQFLGPDHLAGMRGLVVGLTVLGLHFLLALRDGFRFPSITIILTLVLLGQALVFTLSLCRLPVTEYGLWKLQGYLLFSLMPTIVVLGNFLGRPERVGLLFRWLLVISLLPLVLLLILRDGFEAGPVRWALRNLGFDLIGLGRMLGLGALLAFSFALSERRVYLVVLILLGFLMFAGQLLVGERGPILALLVGLVSVSISYYKTVGPEKRVRLRRILAVPLGLSLAGTIGVFLFRSRTVHSLPELRWQIASRGWDLFRDNPLLGTGLGNFTYEDAARTPRQYFHNLFGEVLTESGILGFAALLTFLVLVIRFAQARCRWATGEGHRWHYFGVGVMGFSITAAMVSGDLATNYMVWVSSAIFLCTSTSSRGESAS